jgi:hypothetical protein
MATEMTSGVFQVLFAKLAVSAETRMPIALERVAIKVETEAKTNASRGEHPVRTKTPARPGSGPARISGTLVRSITHSTPKPNGAGWECRVGVAGGMYAPYNRRTTSGKYGYYLETGIRNGAVYPFLGPAFHNTARETAEITFAALFSVGWGLGVA